MNTFYFSVWPYVAAAIFSLALAMRYVLSRQRMAAVLSQTHEVVALFFSSKAWWISLAFLFAAHLAGLLLPRKVLQWNDVAFRLYVLEGVALIASFIAFIGCARLIWFHLGKSGRSTFTEVCDAALLSLLLITICSGSLIAIFYRWGSSWAVTTLTPYVLSIFTRKPALEFVLEMPFTVRLHVFSSFSMLALLPFSRLADLFIATMHFSFTAMAKPISAGAQRLEAWLHSLNPASHIWHEED